MVSMWIVIVLPAADVPQVACTDHSAAALSTLVVASAMPGTGICTTADSDVPYHSSPWVIVTTADGTVAARTVVSVRRRHGNCTDATDASVSATLTPSATAP